MHVAGLGVVLADDGSEQAAIAPGPPAALGHQVLVGDAEERRELAAEVQPRFRRLAAVAGE